MKIAFVSGALANKTGHGGEAWVRLHWIRGLQKLGWRVIFVEQIAKSSCVNSEGFPVEPRVSANRRYFVDVTNRFGLADSAALITDDGQHLAGIGVDELLALADSATMLLNISGHLEWGPLFERLRRKVYIDIDPGFTQFWHQQGNLGARLDGHDDFVTIGRNLGDADCVIPTCNRHWLKVLPPVMLEDWNPAALIEHHRFTTIASWRGPFGVVEFGGRSFGLKVHEFRKFLDLPRRSGAPFEIALAIHAADELDYRRLVNEGWQVVDPRIVADGPELFRHYVQSSRAEFSVAQGIYVDTKSGWFSDRTAAYLAAGRPALVQETGFSRRLPVGEGLVTFRTMDEAVAGAQDIMARYEHHRRAARRLAEEHFAAERVLDTLLVELGIKA